MQNDLKRSSNDSLQPARLACKNFEKPRPPRCARMGGPWPEPPRSSQPLGNH